MSHVTRKISTFTFRALSGVLVLALAMAAPASASNPLPSKSSKASDDVFASIADNYQPVRRSLMTDSLDMVADQAKQIERAAKDARKLDAAGLGVSADDLATVRELLATVEAQAGRLSKASDVESAREALSEMSKPLARWHGLRGGEGEYAVAYCPMVKKSWIQPADAEIGNPYDSSMPNCGSLVGR